MKNVILLLFTVSTSICAPIPSKDASDRSGLVDISTLLSGSAVFQNLNTQVQGSKGSGYYPDFKQYGREQAVLEQEHWISKLDSVYNSAQNKAARYLNVKPLVDTIQEHEKYGNDGEQHRQVAKALVNGFDVLGNAINSVVELPFKAKDYAGKTITAALDAFGSQLVGI